MNGVNGERSNGAESRVEAINQLVRAFCIFILLITFCVAFMWGVYRDKPTVSIEAFVGVLTFAMTWWFKSRDEQRRRTDMLPTVTTKTATGETTIAPTPAPGG